MRTFFLITALLAVFSDSIAQNNIGIGTATPDTSAALDITSNNKGALMPRMTAAQRAGILHPAKGLLVYQTTSPEGFYYNAGVPSSPNWILLGATGPQGPAGVVQSYSTASYGLYPSPSLSFISPTLTITIQAGQKVFLTVSQSLGTYKSYIYDTESLCIYPAYTATTGVDVIHNLGLGACGLKITNDRVMFSINGIFENLPAGTYKFGMSGITGVNGTGVWVNAEWGYVSAIVF